MARPPVPPWCQRRRAGGAKARRGRGVDDAEARGARDGWREGLSLARGRRRKPRSDAGLAAWRPATCLRPAAQSPGGGAGPATAVDRVQVCGVPVWNGCGEGVGFSKSRQPSDRMDRRPDITGPAEQRGSGRKLLVCGLFSKALFVM
jgi:hypothetical protein